VALLTVPSTLNVQVRNIEQVLAMGKQTRMNVRRAPKSQTVRPPKHAVQAVIRSVLNAILVSMLSTVLKTSVTCVRKSPTALLLKPAALPQTLNVALAKQGFTSNMVQKILVQHVPTQNVLLDTKGKVVVQAQIMDTNV
jgi:predicted solute-binding protein